MLKKDLTEVRSFVFYSAKFEATRFASPSIAASSSAPSAISVTAVPLVIPSDKTPNKLLAFTLRSSFEIHTDDVNSFAFMEQFPYTLEE